MLEIKCHNFLYIKREIRRFFNLAISKTVIDFARSKNRTMSDN